MARLNPQSPRLKHIKAQPFPNKRLTAPSEKAPCGAKLNNILNASGWAIRQH